MAPLLSVLKVNCFLHKEKKTMSNFLPVVIIPCFNHGAKVTHVVKACQDQGFSVILIDDGSDRRTYQACEQLRSATVTVLHHRKNAGKGAAMITGFQKALAMGYTHALQVDADAQHDLNQISVFFSLAQKNPRHLIVGSPVYDESVPKARLYGRKITNFWVAIETLSLDMPDALCGFRVYPLAKVKPLLSSSLGQRMTFDPEILVRLQWAHTPILSAPVRVTYPTDGLSHFHARDNWALTKMHTKLCIEKIQKIFHHAS